MAVRKLLRELFSLGTETDELIELEKLPAPVQDFIREVEGLLGPIASSQHEKITRAGLHPAINNFLQQVEGILQNSGKPEETGQPEPAKPQITIRETVTHVTQRTGKSAASRQTPQQENADMQAEIETPQPAIELTQPQTEQVSGEATGKNISGLVLTDRTLLQLYEHPVNRTDIANQPGSKGMGIKMTRLIKNGLAEFDPSTGLYSVTTKGRDYVEKLSNNRRTESVQPVSKHAGVPIADAAEPKTKLPDDLAFSQLLGSAIKTLPPQIQETIRQHALNVLGERLSGKTPYTYQTLRKFEDLVSAVERVVINGGGSEDVLETLQDFQPQTGNKTSAGSPAAVRQRVRTYAQPHAPVSPPEIGTYAQPRPPEPVKTQTAEDYISRLGIAAQDLGSQEQKAIRSYVWKLVGAEAGTQPQDVKTNQLQLHALSVFTEAFARIQKFEDLPHELYDVLDGFKQQDDRDIREFGNELRAAKDSFDVLVAVSKKAWSPYSKAIKNMEDVYREDASIAGLLREREGFHSDTVAARKSIPSLRVLYFYETIKKIPRDIDWGGRYTDLLRFVRVDTGKAVKFMAWASSQNKMDGAQFDREMATYIRLGNRAQPISKEDLRQDGWSHYSTTR
ncbi:MAG: hypothetical protein HY051_00020 [Candidatus Aenigmarchaeota archaeon]|nr:hypothetical protein [Candidatus Aenigmarchaeota archaeon]